MKYIIFLVLSIGVGFASVVVFFLVHKQVEIRQVPLPMPATAFSLENPPPKSLRGTIILLSGDVVWQSRIATQESKLSQGTLFAQGETVETKDTGSITVQFPNASTISLSPKTRIDFIQAILQNLVILQASGQALYKQEGSVPVTVRANGMIVEQKTGEMTVSISSLTGNVVVVVGKNTATVAYEDPDNLSTVIDLQQGDRFVYYPDDREGEVIP